MRYGLRTLLIVLAVGPPTIYGVWLFWNLDTFSMLRVVGVLVTATVYAAIILGAAKLLGTAEGRPKKPQTSSPEEI